MGDLLVVGLNSDASVRRLKGPGRPIIRQADRAAVLGALEPVDFVTIFNEDTPLGLIREIRPDVLAKGADWAKNRVVGKDIVESYGGAVKLVKFLKGYSTTEILKKLR
jgi:D-beta-D-heptose 7-phosphate kinase/D-beta-D-heptose 1-phosphate adenosyltransferase